jgi:polyphosphate glucokinase
MSKTLGIDVGGTNIRMGNVTGSEITDYVSFQLPVVSTPSNVLAYINSKMPMSDNDVIGIAMPCVVQNGYMKTTANIDDSWQNVDCNSLAQTVLNKYCAFINDCDAAALAEMRHGIIRNINGTVIVVTLGTGIGTALFHNGMLFPNTELGHLALYDITDDAEKFASGRIKTNYDLNWYEYTDRINTYLNELHRLFHPSAFVIGGGISESWNDFNRYLNIPCDVYKAVLGNNAGIVGAALYAMEYYNELE